MCCLLEEGSFDSYWMNSGGTALIDQTLLSDDIQEDLQTLLSGKSITMELYGEIAFEQIKDSRNIFYSLLVFAGYLNPKPTDQLDFYELSIPNREVRKIYKERMIQWVARKLKISVGSHLSLMELLTEKRVLKFVERFKEFLALATSSWQTNQREAESFYNGFFLCLTEILNPTFLITSEQESGKGRSDLTLIPKYNHTNHAFIIEYKVCNEEKDLDLTSEKGLKQIKDKKYNIKGLGRSDIVKKPTNKNEKNLVLPTKTLKSGLRWDLNQEIVGKFDDEKVAILIPKKQVGELSWSKSVKEYLDCFYPHKKRAKVTELDISQKDIRGLNSTKVKELDLRHNNFSSDLTPFGWLINLEFLTISNNRFFGSLKSLAKLRKLKSLDIDNTGIDGGLEYLPDIVNCREDYETLKERYNKYGLCQKCQQFNSTRSFCQLCREQEWQQQNIKQLTGQELIKKFTQQQKPKEIENSTWGGKKVALKVLNSSCNITLEFLTEIANTKLVDDSFNVVRCYGISQELITKSYAIVMHYMREGNLRQYLLNKSNSNPKNRPKASVLERTLRKWQQEEREFSRQLREIEAEYNQMSKNSVYKSHSTDVMTSKLIDTKEIAKRLQTEKCQPSKNLELNLDNFNQLTIQETKSSSSFQYFQEAPPKPPN
ncbi:38305_t:CDS:2 [Gigaspora margarita]|uniref:38305_t:CDS:1 n=1 Tax=Gigaspora margarita TaxID=4874 RepID=A0ABN7VMQ7_GIGMA|nr:38305_t:CDS:2 [Gigaspora margarita]